MRLSQVSPAWTAAQIDDTIEIALGGSFSATDTSFGVLKAVAPDNSSILLTLGSAPGLAFNVTLAETFYTLAAAPVPPNCTWANPLLATPPPAPLPNLALGMT